jgi:3-methyl-2-oxobutanoate hydroxymethyltransferase
MSSAPTQITVPADASRLPMTLPIIEEKRRRGEPLVMVTAYDHPGARAAEAAGADLVLVGDSAAMTVLGYDSTVPVTVEEMLMLTAAVRRGLTTPLLIADLPFGSYEASDEQAVRTAQRLVKEAGCDAVKIERGGTTTDRARAIVAAGIPVMGHVGLTPQSVGALGGYRAQGRTAAAAREVYGAAVSLQEAGCFALVLEAIPSEATAAIVPALSIPVIGIGAGPATDGQVLVFHDLLGIGDGHRARFVKRYAEVGAAMVAGIAAYAAEVRAGAYPALEHGYTMAPGEAEQLRAMLGEHGRS